MSVFSFSRVFRLSPSGVDCDEGGLRLGGIPLLVRNAAGWLMREDSDLGRDLSGLYGAAVDFAAKRAGLSVVAQALQDGNVAKAQIAALLLHLPEPPSAFAKHDRPRLLSDLVACGLLKADDDWDAEHPRTGTSPNPGWFANKPKKPAALPKPEGAAPSGDGPLTGRLEFLEPSPAADAPSLLAADLSATALEGLARLAARFNEPALLFDTIFVPSTNRIVDEGPIPGRSDMTYRWAHDETQVRFRVLIDGQWRTLTVGDQRGDLYYDRNGDVVARTVQGKGQRPRLVASIDALDRAAAELRRGSGQTVEAPGTDDTGPKLCPDPTPEPKTTFSENSIRYQEYVSNLTYGLAIKVGGVDFDGCDPATGTLLEAKADIDVLFDNKGGLNSFIYPENDPALQMSRQFKAARAAGRLVVWHAQTQKGFRGLNNIKNSNDWPNLFVVYDPN